MNASKKTEKSGRASTPGAAWHGSFWWWLIGITAVAACVRLYICAELGGHPAAVTPAAGTDMATYKALALDVLQGKWPDVFYYQPLYYALFLPAVYAVFGTGVWGVFLMQSLLGAATVWFTGLATARVFGRRAGLVAALLLALARFHIFHTPYLLFEVLQGFWLALVLWLVVRGWYRPRIWPWLGAALCLGCATLTRGNAVLLLPGVLALAAWRYWHPPTTVATATVAPSRWRRGGRALGVAVLLLALSYLPQLPFAWHNYQHLHRWVGPSSAAGAVLALGNTPESAPGGLSYPTAYQTWMRQAELTTPGARVSVAENMRRWICREPLAWCELKWRMLLLYWHTLEIPNNVVFTLESKDSGLLGLPVVLVDFGCFGTLALIGAALVLGRWRRSPAAGFVLFMLVVGCAATVLFYMLGRFRVPNVPLLCVLAGFAVDAAWRRGRRFMRLGAEARWPLLAWGGLGAASLGLVFAGFPLYTNHVEGQVMRLARPCGVTVTTLDGALVAYDHGQWPLGGWYNPPVPAKGMKLVKEFHLSDEARVMTPAYLALSLPFVAPNGGRLAMNWKLQGKPGGSDTFTLKSGSGVQWVQIGMGVMLSVKERVRVEVTVVPTLESEVSMLMDAYRQYDRTVVFNDVGNALPYPGESCVELIMAPPGRVGGLEPK